MSDKPRFADGSLAQFGFGFAGLVALCLIVAGLSALGMPGGRAVLIFVIVGIAACALRPQRDAMPMARGVSVSMEALSAFGFFGIVGAVFTHGHDGLAVLLGLAAGLTLGLLLIAPRLSAVSARSLPDFLSLRYGSEAIRYLTLAVMSVVTVLFVAAQFAAAGIIAEHGLGVAPLIGVLVCAVVVLTVTFRTGDAGQVSAAILVLLGIAIVTTWLLAAKTGIVVPHVAFGGLFDDIAAAESLLGMAGDFGTPFARLGQGGVIAMILCLAVGTAVMPHTVTRVWTAGSAARTQIALRRGLILFVVAATALPALGVLARAEVLSGLIAGTLESAPERDGVTLALPALLGASGWAMGMLSLVGFTAAVIAATAATVTLTGSASSRTVMRDRPSEMGLSAVIVVVVAFLFLLATGAELFTLGLLAFSLIGASLFAPLVLGLWWTGATAGGAIAGMIGGFVLTTAYIFGAGWGFDFTAGTGDEWSWFGVPMTLAGGFGIALSLSMTVAVSLLTRPR